jgi:hypothetical protein
MSEKAQYLLKCFQENKQKLDILDLDNNNFSNLTLSRQIKQVIEHIENNNYQKVRIIGSSFGGLTAAWLTQKCFKIDSIILLAPAFNFKNNWLPKLKPEILNQWEKTGYLSVYHYGKKRELPLNYQFLTDLLEYDDSEINQDLPTLILHGINDDVISIRSSYLYCKNRSWVKLIELESDHSLTNVMAIIWQEIKQFWHL